MLFKKTLKVALATALWMVPLLGANSAMAQAVSTLPMYSAETLRNTGTAARPKYGINNSPTTDVDPMRAVVALAPRARYRLVNAGAGEDQVFIRVAATGVLRFERAPVVVIGHRAPGTTTTDYTTNTALGTSAPSADGMGAYIYTVAAAQTNPFDVRVEIGATSGDDDAAVSGPGNGGVMVSVYRGAEDANFGEGATDSSASKELLSVRHSVVVKTASASPELHTATATSRFTKLDGFTTRTSPYEVNFGGFDIQVTDSHRTPNGQTIAEVAEATATSTPWAQTGVNGGTRFYGDGGWAFASGFRLAGTPTGGTVASCAGSGPDGSDPGPQDGDGAGIMSSPLSEEDPTDDVMGGIKEDPWVLCVTISNENEETIPEGVYNLDVNLSLTTAQAAVQDFPPNSKAGLTIAVIGHDGTTVQIPFVTSYDGYTQRIVIVNRNKVDVSYALEFRAEGDGMIDGSNPHEGMLMAGQATVLKVADLVTLSSPTRASATLTVAAKSATIDVATTMVNKMDQSTDTVVLD